MYLSGDSTLPTTPKTPSGDGFWSELFGAAPSLIETVAGLFGKKPKQDSLYSQLGPSPKSNTALYVIGGVLVVTIAGTVIALNRRRRVSR